MSNNFVEEYAPLIGRILLGAIFVIYGLDKVFGFLGMGYSGLTGAIASKGLPVPDLFAVITIMLEVGGGLMLVLGFKARLGALALILFIVPVTVLFHPFWSDPAQMTSFWKNAAIAGGMLYVVAHGSGPYSMRS